MKNFYKRSAFLNLVIFISFVVNAQNSKEDNIKTANQLKQKYPESSAVILNSENNIDFLLENDQVGVVESSNRQIMSLRFNNALKRSLFYDINSKISEDCVKNEKNKKLYVVPICGNYESEDIFQSDNMICVYPLEFKTLGEVQNFSYKLTSNDIRYYTAIYFQSDIPTQKVKYTFNVPSWLDLEVKEFNFSNYKIERTIKKDGKKGMTIYEYSATILDEFKDEPHSFGISHTYPHLLIISKSYQDKNGKKKNIISNIDDLYNWYGLLVKQLKNDNTALKPVVEKITANAKTDLDKIKSIFYWVQDNIRYIAFENGIAGYKPAEASDVFKRKFGDCKGMANLTKWMLTIAGFDARLAWIGTNSVPYDYNIPSLAINNHMICCVNINKQRYYLDATEKYIGLNDYAERIQGRVVMVEDGKKYFLDTIPVFDKKRNLNTVQFDLAIKNDKFSGKCKQNYHGESHQFILYYLNNEKKESQKELKDDLITSGDKNILADNITSSEMSDKENPYNIEADVIVNNKISNFDNDYYLDLDFYKDFNNQTVKATRNSDVLFDEKKYQKLTVNLTIPSSLKLKQLPSSLEINEKYFGFSIKYSVKNNIISYERIISIDKGWIPKSEIEKWNNTIKAVSEKYKENVILTKI